MSLHRVAAGRPGHALRPAVASGGSAFRRPSHRHAHWVDERAGDDERLKLLAALLALGSLLVWILFLQG